MGKNSEVLFLFVGLIRWPYNSVYKLTDRVVMCARFAYIRPTCQFKVI